MSQARDATATFTVGTKAALTSPAPSSTLTGTSGDLHLERLASAPWSTALFVGTTARGPGTCTT